MISIPAPIMIGIPNDERGPPVPSHPVEHPEERRGKDRGEGGCCGRREAAHRSEQRDTPQRSLAAESVPRKRDEERRAGPTGQTGADNVSDLRRVEPELGEIDPEEDTDKPCGECAQKRRDVKEEKVANGTGWRYGPGALTHQAALRFALSRQNA